MNVRDVEGCMKVAVAQIKLHNNIDCNLRTISRYIVLASKEGVNILCFPECSVTGYVRDFSKLNQNKIMGALDIIQKQVAKDHVNVIVGTPYFEQKNRFNSAVVLLTNGERYIYHKINLTPSEEVCFKKGKTPLIFHLDTFKFGILICRDQNNPALASKYKALGADAIFILSAHFYTPIEARGKRDKNRALPIARAVENNLFIFKANAVGSNTGKVSLGGSIIVNPDGFITQEGDSINEITLNCEILRGGQ